MIRPLRDVERDLIIEAITYTRGDVLRAAELLGIGKTKVYRKLYEYGITRSRQQQSMKFSQNGK